MHSSVLLQPNPLLNADVQLCCALLTHMASLRHSSVRGVVYQAHILLSTHSLPPVKRKAEITREHGHDRHISRSTCIWMIGCWWHPKRQPGVLSWQSRSGCGLAARAAASAPAVLCCRSGTVPAQHTHTSWIQTFVKMYPSNTVFLVARGLAVGTSRWAPAKGHQPTGGSQWAPAKGASANGQQPRLMLCMPTIPETGPAEPYTTPYMHTILETMWMLQEKG